MIKTLIKLKILKFILIGGVLAGYAFKRYCDQKNKVRSKKDKKLLLPDWKTVILIYLSDYKFTASLKKFIIHIF